MVACALFASQARAADLYWDADGDGSVTTGGTGNWDTSALRWRLGSATGSLVAWPNAGSNDAYLRGTTGTLTLSAAIALNDLYVAPTSGTGYTIAGSQTLTFRGAATPVVNVAGGATLTISSSVAGGSGLIVGSAPSPGSGTFILNAASGSAGLFGGITVNGGTLQAGAAATTATQVLRSNAVNLAGGNLTSVGEVHLGSLAGSGSVTPGGNKAIVLSGLSTASYAGTVTTSGGLSYRGFNTTQTFTGTVSALTGTVAINGVSLGSGTTSSGVTLSSNAALSSASTLLSLCGGTLTLDNTSGNTGSGSATNRLGSGAISSTGGTLSVIGNATSGSSETVGAVTIGSGATTINVTHNGGPGGTSLSLGGLTRPTNGRSTIDFANLSGSGTLGTTDANPRILIGNSFNSGMIGPWATVNGVDYASYNGAVGVTGAIAYTPAASGTSDTSSYCSLNGPLEKTSIFNAAGIKIAPSAAGQSLLFTGGSLNSTGVLLTGSVDYTIARSDSATNSKFTGVATRYIGVANASTTLLISIPFGSSGSDVVKYGDGFLSLTADNSGNSFLGGNTASTNTTFVINAGVLRATVGDHGAIFNGGALGQTSVALRGGVLEINGGANGTGSSADFIYALGTGRNNVSWDGVANDTGSGGFSAFASAASVNVGGGATPATLTWNSTNNFVRDGYALLFGSIKSNAALTFLNPIGLDDGVSTNGYVAREIRVADNSATSADVTRLAGAISGSANADLVKTGAGELQLAASNTFAGNTLIQQGTLTAVNGSALPDTGLVSLNNAASTTLKLANSETIGALSGGGAAGGNVDLQANVLTVGDARDTTFGGVISGTTSAAGVTKQGSGRLTLTNASTYAGTTTVSAGTLVAANDPAVAGSATGTSTVTVAGGTLAGTGRVGSVAVNNGGTLTAGSGATTGDSIGTLISAGQTWNAGGTTVAKFNAGGTTAGVNYDVQNLTGVLDLVGLAGKAYTIVLRSVTGSTLAPSATPYELVNADGGIRVNGTPVTASTDLTSLFTLSTEGLSAPDAEHAYHIRAVSDGSGYDLMLSYDATPEPTTAALLTLAGTPLLGRRRCRGASRRPTASARHAAGR